MNAITFHDCLRCHGTGEYLEERDCDGQDLPCWVPCWDCEERAYMQKLERTQNEDKQETCSVDE